MAPAAASPQSAPSPSYSSGMEESTSAAAPPATRKQRQSPKSNVILADTFPAKTHLLVSNLTESDPAIASFSADGTSFHIFDQAVFAQTYLPQYFKHSNYGSFVRQLNLYGFTSSRLKVNSDVIVWNHEYFHRDRKDLIKKIKRTKKQTTTSTTSTTTSNTNGSKSDAKPPPAHVRTHPHRIDSPAISESTATDTEHPSSPPLSSSIPPSPNNTNNSNNNSNTNTNTTPYLRQISGSDQDYFRSEFAFLKNQNVHLERLLEGQLRRSRFVEEKLDVLMELLTVRITGGANNGVSSASNLNVRLNNTAAAVAANANANYDGTGGRGGEVYYGASHDGGAGEKRRRMMTAASPRYSNHGNGNGNNGGGGDGTNDDSYSAALAAWSQSQGDNNEAMAANGHGHGHGHGRVNHDIGLESIREEQKMAASYYKDDEFEPMPYQEERKISYHNNGGGGSNNNIGNGNGDEEKSGREDSFKEFIDVMLDEEDDRQQEEEEKEEEQQQQQLGRSTSEEEEEGISDDEYYTTNYAATATTAAAASATMPLSYDIDDDELMADAIDALLPELNQADEDLIDDMQNSNNYPPKQAGFVTVTNAAMDKSSGPDPIAVVSSAGPEPMATATTTTVVSSPDHVPSYEGDIEEGNNTYVVSATLVEENNREGSMNAADEEDERQKRRHRKMVIYLLFFIGFVALVGIVVTPAVIVTNNNKREEEESSNSGDGDGTVVIIKNPGGLTGGGGPGGLPGRPSGLGGGNGYGGKNVALTSMDYYDDDDEEEEDKANDDGFYKFEDPSLELEDLEDLEAPKEARSHNLFSSNSQDVGIDGRLRSNSFFMGDNSTPTFSSFSVSIQGTDFVCSREFLE